MREDEKKKGKQQNIIITIFKLITNYYLVDGLSNLFRETRSS